jgi:chromosome segregation protein
LIASPFYRRLVRELEALLPPRLVAQLLQNGLKACGQTPATASPSDLSAVLEDHVLPPLRASLGPEAAQETARHLLSQLQTQPPTAPPEQPDHLHAQARAIEVLGRSLEGTHLLLEWGEVGRLRALLELIAAEHALGRDASAPLAEAQVVQARLWRKLEARLAAQAGELTALEARLATLTAAYDGAACDGAGNAEVRLRRLRALLKLIRRAHEGRELADAELERAHALASELESDLEAARAQRSRRLAAETREVEALKERFAALFALEPETARHLAAAHAQLRVGEPLGEALQDLPAQLSAAQSTLQAALRREVKAVLAREAAEAAPDEEVLRDLTLTLKVLESALPSPSDLQRVRDYARTAGDRSALRALHRFEADAAPYRDLPGKAAQALRAALAAAREHFEAHGTPPHLEGVGEALARARAESEALVEALQGRLHAAEAALEALGTLADERAHSLRWTLRRLRAQLEAAGHGSPGVCSDLAAEIADVEAQLGELQGGAHATREVAAQLVQSAVLDDLLGLPYPPPAPTSAGTDPLAPLRAWLEACCAAPSVAGAALFATPFPDAAHPPLALAAGALSGDLQALQRAARLCRRRAEALGLGLGAGAARLFAIETPTHALLLSFLPSGLTLALVTPAPTWSGAARQLLEASLPELQARLQTLPDAPTP